MLKKDNMISGLLAGAVFPATAWIIFSCLFPAWVILDKPLIPYCIAIALNLIIARVCFAKHAVKTVTGVIIVTFIIMLALFTFKLKPGS